MERGTNVDTATNTGATPLFAAAWNGRVDVVRLLVERGANVDTATIDGQTPLHIAAIKGRLAVARFLVERGADVRVTDNEGKTPLQDAQSKLHVLLSPTVVSAIQEGYRSSIASKIGVDASPVNLTAAYQSYADMFMRARSGALATAKADCD